MNSTPHTIPVSEILRYRDTALDLSEAYQYDDIDSVEGIRSDLHIQLNASGFRVYGNIRGSVTVPCDRCLEPVCEPIAIRLDEQYVFSWIMPAQARDQEVQIEDFYEEIDEDGELDVRDLVHQMVLVETAVQHVCGRESCQFPLTRLEQPSAISEETFAALSEKFGPARNG